MSMQHLNWSEALPSKLSKAFSAALLAATVSARGTNTGENRENAISTRLFDLDNIAMTLHSWNSDFVGGPSKFHGDLEITSKGYQWMENILFGFCIGHEWATAAVWDCMKVTAGVNGTKILRDRFYASSFEV